MNYTIEKMTGDDVRAVREIDSRSAALPWPLSSYEYEVRHNLAGRATVARSRDGLILGFLMAWLIVDEFHVANIAVDTPFRRLGIGYALMRQGLIAANRDNARQSFLEVRISNRPAIELYEKIGYETVSIRKGYYRDNNEDALNMNLFPAQYQAFIERETQQT
ncbi:ribosomal-protein-alanine N-acetyltransferase [Anaerolineaceae bacterium oral taxon 439]|nr:ribosomal-protein-alanine N-acetyltransferase [Anaerolineaceae bacterium oral taxon 439]